MERNIPAVKNPPTFEIREWQWREQFQKETTDWFCIVVENPDGDLIGFAKGNSFASPDLPGYTGELNKIYLLKDFHRLGLGRRLVGHVARKFLRLGITSMVLFGVPENPAIYFHQALGGERLLNKEGGFDGGFGWRDLEKLASICPID